ncbi:MAG: hypothetical protein JWO97_137 [Acidobacteria bacterium]|nr:hypothetical protein [Acidobacteriota bacterium]
MTEISSELTIPAPADEPAGSITRRRFVAQAAAVTTAAAVAGIVPRAFAQTSAECATETLLAIDQIVSRNHKLKGVIKIRNAQKNFAGFGSKQKPMMRYFEGYDQQAPRKRIWPPTSDACLPGPTLRMSVGDRVEITFLNQVDVGAFPGGTLDAAETGQATGCDQATNGNTGDKGWYPTTRGDSFPNCFHGSSTANLHFHGTHVTPDGFGDNVLVQLRPDPTITEDKVTAIFDEVFAQCEAHGKPQPWKDLPESFRTFQEKGTRNYDLHAIWQSKRGPIKDANGKDVPALPEANQLTPANAENIAHGLWPQYFVGAFPNCWKVTDGSGGEKMAQAPGTHWYHSHKHGSTSINLYNGLAGAMIIEGQYDKDLEKIYPNIKKTEKVLVVQEFTDLPDLERVGPGRTAKTTTNGTPIVKAKTNVAQVAPTIVMRPGEIQLWRIVNAQVGSRLTPKFTGVAGVAVSPLPKFRQIAQDGVQFNRFNYNLQPLTTKDADGNGTTFSLIAGGRIDILVQAPKITTASESYEFGGIVNVVVCGTAADDQFPDGSATGNYPTFPTFLGNISSCNRQRTLTFDWEPFRIATAPAAATGTHAPSKTLPFDVQVGNERVGFKTITIAENRAPYYMIDDEQFSEHRYYQTMILGDQEEWLIENNTIVPHPFHIHVNPFQVVEVVDPNTPANNYTAPSTGGFWQDVMAIPAAKADANGDLEIDPATGRATKAGSIRIRSRFVDFPGTFVLHCHILAHEDRGMMQLVRVIDGSTTIKHH